MLRLFLCSLLIFALFSLSEGYAQADAKQSSSLQTDVQTAQEPSTISRVILYIQSKQREFHRELASAVRAVRVDGSAMTIWWLIIASFLYGVFQAAGPGHGKAVISTYLHIPTA